MTYLRVLPPLLGSAAGIRLSGDPVRRRAAGQSIGSGMIEGACQTVVGKWLKQTGARWRVRHAERMTARRRVLYGDHWDTYWEAKAILADDVHVSPSMVQRGGGR